MSKRNFDESGESSESDESSESGERHEATETAKPAVKRPRLQARRSASSDGYGLIHTLGRTKFDPLGGDGAYAKWMQEYFEKSNTPEGCRAVEHIKWEGSHGNIKDAELSKKFNPGFLALFEATINSPEFETTSRIILNWHIRFTGTPNGYTGRGLNQGLVGSMRELCHASGKKLGIVYTVHEKSNLDTKLHEPAGIVTLNKTVGRAMQDQFSDVDDHLISLVPGLLRSKHTVKLDDVRRLVEGYVKGDDFNSDASDLYWAHGQQLLRVSNAPDETAVNRKGIVIFGMITPRHGLNTDAVEKLATRMNSAALDSSLKIVIAGKPSDANLVTALKQLASRNSRVSLTENIEGLDHLAGCKYAISFDHAGYRTNASAMVNLVREGHVLFSRESNETDDDLIARAARDMRACERNNVTYYDMLARSQPRLREASPYVVGPRLDRFFASIARNL